MTEAPAVDAPRIRAWVQSEAAQKSPEQIRDYVYNQAEQLFAAANAFEPAQLGAYPAGDEWTPLDALKHVVEWNWQVGEDILHMSLTGERPGNPPPTFEPDREGLIARQRESLESVWAHVSAADPEGFLHLTWEHPFLGAFNWREWFLFLGAHMYDHTGQLKAMKQVLDA